MSTHAKHMPPKPAKGKLKRAVAEVMRNEPRAVAATRGKKGAKAARKQAVAIAYSKARKAK